LNHLDGEKLIRDLIATGAGTITPSGVIFDNDFRLEPHYTGRNFPVYYDKRYLMEMELTPVSSEPEDAPSRNRPAGQGSPRRCRGAPMNGGCGRRRP